MNSNILFKSLTDERGSLVVFDNLQEFSIKRFYIIDCLKDMWRGNHYHKNGKQLICVIEGLLEVKISTENSIATKILKPGDIFVQEPFCKFEFCSRDKSSKLIVLCDTIHDPADYYT